MVLGLQCRRSVAVLHFLCCLWAVFALSQNIGLPQSSRWERDDSYGGHWKHLTFLNQILQTILFLLCVIIDFVGLCTPSHEKKVSSLLVPIRDFIFSVFVFPVGLFVAVVFWGLYAYDRELVYPRELDDVNPTWLNHSMHTTILPLLFIELVICPHKYIHPTEGIFGLTVFTFTYLCWIMWVHYASGIWAYPVLGVLNTPGKIVFFSIAYCIVLTFYVLGKVLTKQLWARRRKQS
ncbi:PREDICTED: androgen-induced gene 1 protein-like [Gekko japonicus]|uniref:Androgen-induced gene 1 protein-like n=1 Tax=Gekko japonicus TaxID=146911 RepID=A0ABM1K423_GEKJA|nr:PREDICTED: androgen-induced gene 1 protein-like [Gekko japonicus]